MLKMIRISFLSNKSYIFVVVYIVICRYMDKMKQEFKKLIKFGINIYNNENTIKINVIIENKTNQVHSKHFFNNY